MKELFEALEGTKNVKSISYDTDTKLWTITYKNVLPADEMPSSILIDFLNNG